MEDKSKFSVSDSSLIQIPLKNLIALIFFTVTVAIGYADLRTSISAINNRLEIEKPMIDMNTEFRTKWPRGELGSLPADIEQNLRLEQLRKELDELKSQVNKGCDQ